MPTVHALRSAIEQDLGVEVAAMAQLGGGDVADAYRMDVAGGDRFFAKTHPDPPPEFFVTEAAGLGWLAAAAAVAVPEVLGVGDAPVAYLALEWIDEGPSGPGTEAALGRALAALHDSGSPAFGRADRRTTGSRRLPNEPCDTWAEFYATRRLLPLARLARDGKALPERDIARLEQVAGRLDQLGGPPEPPARLHGDLWAGNRLVDRSGSSWLIDPAAHGGHREFDLAMMRLFGGFGPDCFAAYHEVFPVADGWAERVPLHQLAPLVTHAIKFGGGYVGATIAALDALGA